jgi:uracil-DNA glycosylase
MEKAKIIEHIGESWYNVIGEEFNKPYMVELRTKLSKARDVTTVYPKGELVFRAFRETPFDKVKVVWFGQDPYHDGSATGLAFECGKKYLTPSWKQVLKAYEAEFPHNFATDLLEGELSRWASNGVLLLNTALTVEQGVANSHTNLWSKFTNVVIEALIADRRPKVFAMLGKKAQRYQNWVTVPHYSVCREHPQAANYENRDWDHGKIFTTINAILKQNGVGEVDW